jgi:hypothetical protein
MWRRDRALTRASASTAIRLVALWALASATVGCASSLGHGSAPPSPASIGPAATAGELRVLPNGLKLLVSPARDGVFSAGLLIGGGPLDDPPALPGLTELALQAALLGTEGDPDGVQPTERALGAGGSLHTVADGRVFGWVVRAPAPAAGAMLGLLHDLATAPTLPASRFDILVALVREQVATDGLGGTGTGIAVAIGTALGLGRAVPLGPTLEMLERVNREEVLRHFTRMARPDRAILVVRVPPGLELPAESMAAFASWERNAAAQSLEPAGSSAPCLPLGQTLHRIVTSDAAKTRSIALVAVPAPSVGDPERAALDSLAVWLAARPGGPIERLVGPDEALRARPWILDVGWGRGRGVAVLLSAAGGDNDQAAQHLRGISELLAAQAAAVVLTPDQAVDAHRAVTGRQRLELQAPLTGLVAEGTRALYSVAATSPSVESIHRMAARWLAPHRQSLVVIGFADLSTDDEEHVREAVWDQAGQPIEGATPVRCVPLDLLRDEKPVDSAGPPR